MLEEVMNEDTDLLTQAVKFDKMQPLTLVERLIHIGGFINIRIGVHVNVVEGFNGFNDGTWLEVQDFIIDVSGEEIKYYPRPNDVFLPVRTWTFDGWVAQL